MYGCDIATVLNAFFLFSQGIACDLDSDGHHMLRKATEVVLGEAKPFSICGSLPLVGDLQEAGFDVQVRVCAKL